MKKLYSMISIILLSVLLTSCTLGISTLPPTAFYTPMPTPTKAPTATPVLTPTDEPTLAPTDTPTDTPTDAPTSTPTVTPAPTSAPSRLKVSVDEGSTLRFRSSPSSTDSSNVLGSLPNGAVVELVTANAAVGWHKVRTADGTEGFLSSDFLIPADEDEPLTPLPTPIPTPTDSPDDPQGIVYTPTASGPLSGFIIGINPGHQLKGDYTREPMAPGSSKTNPKCATGAQGVSTGTAESTVTLSVGLKLRDALLDLGATVVMSRIEQDVNISNSERARMFNRLNADLVVNLHCNGADDAPQVQGVLMCLYDKGEYKTENLAASKSIVNAFVEATGAHRMEDLYLYELSSFCWSTQPTVLIEMGFMTNAEEDRRLCTESYQDKMTLGITNGILDYFDGRAPLNP